MLRIFCFATLLVCSGLVWADVVPREKHVQLNELTDVSVDVAPNLGVQLVFPFLLNEPGTEFSSNLVNKRVFDVQVPTPQNPRNDIIISLKGLKEGVTSVPSNFIGTLYLKVRGYAITILLRTTSDYSRHYTSLVFDLSSQQRQYFLDAALQTRLAASDKDCKIKPDGAGDRTGYSMGDLGVVALADPKTTRVKEEGKTKLKGGGKASLYVDRILTYDRYQIMMFEVENDGVDPLVIQDAKIGKVTGAASTQVNSDFRVTKTVPVGEVVKGVVVTDDVSLLDANKLSLRVTTATDVLEVKW